MKKFTSIATALAGILAILGVGCLIAAFAMGVTLENFAEMLQKGNFSINLGSHHIGIGNMLHHDSDMMGVSDEAYFDDCENLEIELSAGSLKIYYDDVTEIQVEQSNIEKFQSYMEDNTLHIEAGKKAGIHNGSGQVVVIIPNNKKFSKVDLEIGAGQATISELMADTMHAEIGAGQAEISKLTVEHLEAETGTGQLQIELNGKETDYSYDIECGIGEIQIGNSSYSGFGKSQQKVNDGCNKSIDLECGIGEIQIKFTE